MGFNFLKKEKENLFWVLDIGNEAVKTLIIERDGNRIAVLGVGMRYFDSYGSSGGSDSAETILKKAISKSIEEALQRFSIASKNKVENQWKKWPVFIGLPPDMLKARISRYYYERAKPEEKISKSEEVIICRKCLESIKNEISNEFAKDAGILVDDIHWVGFEISKKIIDGYAPGNIIGVNGRKLEFNVLAIFMGEYYYKNIERILASIGLRILRMIHISENFFSLPISEKSNSALFDIGGDVVQLFLTRNGFLEKINEFKLGGRIFTEKLSDVLGISEESARILKEKYSNNTLNSKSAERVKEIFSHDKSYWKRDLELGLKKIGCNSHSFDDIFIFGGAGSMPEVREVFSSMVGDPFCEAKIIYPKSISGFDDYTKILDSSQYAPCLMIANSILKN